MKDLTNERKIELIDILEDHFTDMITDMLGEYSYFDAIPEDLNWTEVETDYILNSLICLSVKIVDGD